MSGGRVCVYVCVGGVTGGEKRLVCVVHGAIVCLWKTAGMEMCLGVGVAQTGQKHHRSTPAS